MLTDILLALIILELFLIFLAVFDILKTVQAPKPPQAVMTPFVVEPQRTQAVVVNEDEGTGTYKGPQSWT